MNRNVIWISGQAASGKSTVIRELSTLLPNCRILSDAEEMLRLNQEDVNHLYHSHPHGEGSFLLTSSHHFDTSIRRLVEKLKTETSKTTFVELARGGGAANDIDLSYRRFLEIVPQKIFNSSVFLYIRADWQVRIARNSKRASIPAVNLERESFFVPAEAMESFFQRDDFDEVKEAFPCPIYEIDNNTLTEDQLQEAARSFLKHTLTGP